ncbi:MAG: TIM barrel protein [Pirellulales bacterium]|nr:TIM barrel protein [Pirellulales bacterium]
MQRLLSSYALYLRYKHHRPGHLFQGRFKARLVEDEVYLLAVTRYVHLNLVLTAACPGHWKVGMMGSGIAGRTTTQGENTMFEQTHATRRQFLRQCAAAGALAASGILVSSPGYGKQWSAKGLRLGSCILDLEEAKQIGLEGAEIRANPAGDNLDVADPAVRRQYKEQMKKTGLPISSLMLGLLNSYPLASDPRGPAWLEQSIEAAKDLGAGVILVAFFSKGNLLEDGKLKKADVDVVVERIKAAAPKAKEAGVVLGIENLLSAQQNAEILDRIGSDAVRIYYDVGNTTGQGYDVPAEIRFLKDRIAIFHFKDNPHYLGEGKVQFEAIADAIRDIGYRGWIVLETTSPSKDKLADAKRNAAFVRKLFGMG